MKTVTIVRITVKLNKRGDKMTKNIIGIFAASLAVWMGGMWFIVTLIVPPRIEFLDQARSAQQIVIIRGTK